MCPLTVSIGLAHTHDVDNDTGTALTGLLRRADVAMYEAKRRGGDAVVTDVEDDESRSAV